MSDMKSKLSIFWHLRHGVLNRRNIVITLLTMFLLTIAFLNIGSSTNKDIESQEDLPVISEYPDEIILPTQQDGGFNFSNDFSEFPSISPPSEFLDPTMFNPEDWGGGFNFSNPGGEIPDVSFPTGSIPDISFPTFAPPTFAPPTINPPTISQPPISQPEVPETSTALPNNNTGSGFNFSIPDRDNKARNLPQIHLISNFSIDINIPVLDNLNLDITLTVEGLLFISILLIILILNKQFIPDLIRRLEEENEEYTETKASTLFISPQISEEEKEKQKQRIRRLMIFRDHVEEIITNSKGRMEKNGAEHTIIEGYYDLDNAFAEFVNLVRGRDITPLEHAHQSFETGEIDNERLEEIVNLFYYARFGQKAMSLEEGWEFIDHLINLVLKEGDET